MSRRRLVLLWLAATACAETVGYSCAAVLFGIPGGPLLGGLVEGTALGIAQGLVLRRRVRDFPVVAWWGITAALAAIGWGSASAFQGGGGGGGEPPVALIVLGGAGLGVAMGALLGTGQWLVLRQRFARAWTWVPASAVGWGAGMIPAFWVASAPQTAPGALELLGLGAAGGLLMGLAVGAVTGWQLSRLSGKEPTGRPRVEAA